MPNAWIEHIKNFAKANNTTFGCALSNPKCRETYKKPSQTKQPTFKEIQENRKKVSKIAMALSRTKRREARDIINSQTKSSNHPPIDLSKEKIDPIKLFTAGLNKKKTGVIL